MLGLSRAKSDSSLSAGVGCSGGFMATKIEQELIEKLRILPPEQQQAVLEIVERMVQPASKMTILEKISERSKQVPDEVWERVPTDGAEQHDHYLYGAPKK